MHFFSNVYLCVSNYLFTSTLSLERDPFSAKNQTL